MKFNKFYFIISLIAFSIKANAQQITGQILDNKTSEPIAFATVQYDDNNGVVSNMEGFFTLSLDKIPADKPLTISFMGYQTQNITIKELQNSNLIIKLKEAVNQLNTVYITTKLPSVDSIMARVNRNLDKNYKLASTKQTLFSRDTRYFKAKKIDVDITKSTGFKKSQLDASNAQFEALSNQIVNNPPTQSFTDALVELYQLENAQNKMEVKQATKLIDRKNNISLENIQSRVAKIVLEHLDTTKTYKLKSGWFKIEDSMSLKSAKKTKNEIKETDNSFTNLKSSTLSSLNSALFKSKSNLDFITEMDTYKYEIQGVTTIDDQLVYIVNFEPRRSKAKFKGQIFVNDEDYAVLKVNYGYDDGKHGEKLNLRLLLGVKYVENVNDGTIIYRKNSESNTYYPYYVNQKSGQYVYAHRPLKFIENDDDSSNKIAFDLILEGSVIEKYELMSLDNQVINEQNFSGITEPKNVEYIKLKQYDPTLWKDYNILEPLEELKKFKVEE